MVDTIIVDEVGKVRIPTEIEGALSEDDLFISDKAIEMIQEIRKQNNVPEDYFLRIATRGGGCSGMNYALGFDNEFDEQNDRKFVTDKVNLVVDAKSLFYQYPQHLPVQRGDKVSFLLPKQYGRYFRA